MTIAVAFVLHPLCATSNVAVVVGEGESVDAAVNVVVVVVYEYDDGVAVEFNYITYNQSDRKRKVICLM